MANGGFCLPCVLFATAGYQGGDPGILVRRPLTSFSKALELLDKHRAKSYHLAAVTRSDEFLRVMQGQQPDIRQRMDKVLEETVATNRWKLSSITKTVLLCGRQNISLCGHRDSAKDSQRDDTSNLGNFWALLKFRVDAGDTVLADHLTTACRNATYTSPDIQNQLVAILGDQIRDTILRKVKEAQWYTVIADEVTDASNKEQLSLVLRYMFLTVGL